MSAGNRFFHNPVVLFLFSFIAYFLTARLSLYFLVLPENVSVFWPPLGLLLGLLGHFPMGTWIWILAGAFPANVAANLLVDKSLIVSAGFAAVDCLAAPVGAWAMARCAGKPVNLSGIRDVLCFVVLGAIGVSAAAAAPGALIAVWGLGQASFWSVWQIWAFADFAGILVVAPVVLTFPRHTAASIRHWLKERAGEALFLFIPHFLLANHVYSWDPGTSRTLGMRPNSSIPFLLWAAIRFGPAGAAWSCFTLSLIVIWHTVGGRGPFLFGGNPIPEGMIQMQIFLGVVPTSILVVAAVISERKRIEKARVESETLYRQAIAVAGAVPYTETYHPRRVYTYVGAGIESITGLSPSEFTDENMDQITEEIIPLGDLRGIPVDDAMVVAMQHEGVSWQADYRIRLKDGTRRWLANAAVQIRDPDGKVTGSLGILQDITERKAAQDALMEAYSRFEAIFENTPLVAIQGYTRDGVILHWNKASEDLYGYSAEEALGKKLQDLILDADGARLFKSIVNEIWTTGQPMLPSEFPVVTRGGGNRWVYSTMFPVVSDGKTVEVFCMDVDITDRKEAEETLRLRERAIQSAGNGILISDHSKPDNPIIFVNAAFERITGYTAQEVIGKNARFLQGPEPSQDGLESIRSAITRQTGTEVVVRNYRKDGTPFWNELSIAPVRNDSGEVTHWVGIQNDITDRIRLEEERRKLEEQIHHAQKLESLGVLAGGIAHDFNNLLMGVLGNASLALADLSPESPARESLNQIEKAALRAADLARQMLAYSGKGRFVIQQINLSHLVEEMSHLLEVSISKKAILRVNFAANLPTIEADATQIRQVIMNLITNASDAIGEKSGVITISTGVVEATQDYLAGAYLSDELTPGYYVYCEVSDTGCGMDEETRSKVFDPFFTTKFTGRGLGLAAVLGIVRGHRGAIKIYTQAGKGTTFKVLFPCSDKRADDIPLPADESADWKGSGLLLVVDDEETVTAISKRMLEARGFSVLTARDGKEGVDLFRERHGEIRLVLLDMTMPHMDGEEAFRMMRQIDPEARIILTSGYNEQDATGRFAGKRLAGFIQKPYTPGALMQVVRSVLKE